MKSSTKEYVFGSKEWMNELKRRVNFPKMFVVYYGLHEKTNEPLLFIEYIETQSKESKNIPYGFIKPSSIMALSPYKWLVEGVYYIKNAEEYLEKIKELSDRWNIDLISRHSGLYSKGM